VSRVSDGGTCAPEIVWYGEVVNMRATVSDPETRRSRKDGSCDGKKKMDQEIQQQYALPAEGGKKYLCQKDVDRYGIAGRNMISIPDFYFIMIILYSRRIGA